jgi:hypothetical protein
MVGIAETRSHQRDFDLWQRAQNASKCLEISFSGFHEWPITIISSFHRNVMNNMNKHIHLGHDIEDVPTVDKT